MTQSEAAALEALDEEFYGLQSIDELLSPYVDRHPGAFFSD